MQMFSEAFASDHNIILGKFSQYNILGIALNWFITFLSDHYQYVSMDTSFSS